MRKCKINYTGLTAVHLNELCAQVVLSLTGNANFTALPITLADITLANTALDTAIINSVTKDRVKLSIVRDKKAIVAQMLQDTAQYVNSVCLGNETMLLTSGLLLNKVPAQRGVPETVTNVKAVFTNTIGSIRVKWNYAKFAKSYNVFMSADDGQTWSMLKSTFTRNLLCQSLQSGKRYQFKVVALNNAGTGLESDIANQMAA